MKKNCILHHVSNILEMLGEKSKNKVLFAEVEERKHADEANHRKILSLKDENKRLSDALHQEKEKSRLTILKLMNEAEDVIAEANKIKSIADEKMSAAELIVFQEKEKAQNALKREREYTSFAVASCKFISILSSIIEICAY
jgi:hypothetical protein